MEDFSKDAVILTAFENKEALDLLTCDLVRRGVGLVLLIDDSSGSAAGSSAIPGLTILRQTPDRDDAPTLRDALQYLNLHRPDMESVSYTHLFRCQVAQKCDCACGHQNPRRHRILRRV